MFKVLVVLPSSNPVNWAWSLNLSNTCILSTTSAGKFLSAIVGSSPKNGLPSTNTCFTCSPFTVTVPFDEVTPGILVTKSSALASGCVLYESALNSTVSVFWVIKSCFPLMATSLSTLSDALISNTPSSASGCFPPIKNRLE